MSGTPSRLEKLLDFFGQAGMELAAEEVAEILWLAARLPAAPSATFSPPVAVQTAAPPAIPPGATRQSLPPSRAETLGPAQATVSSATQSEPTTTGLYPLQAGVSTGGMAARTIRSPAAFALPGTLELGRCLRPLQRRVPSRSRLLLDENATAHRIADTGDWTPVLHYAPERWLDVFLIVDESSSMIIWQRTLSELQNLLERQGAFRNVEVLGFRVNSDDTGISIHPGIGATADRNLLRRPAELIDPVGRRLIAVVSDCICPVWHNGVMAKLLSEWGQAGPATIVQVLPDRLWVRTGLRTCPAIYLRSPAPGAPNSLFEIEWTNYRPKAQKPRGIAVPVVSLEPASLDHWARAVAGNSNLWIPGVFAMPAVPVMRARVTTPQSMPAGVAAPALPPEIAPTRFAANASPDQLARLFYGTASPTARVLASFLAAVPLTLPIIRLVQRAMLPDSRQVHLAEIWLSGLIDRPTEIDYNTPADDVEYRFVNGVRELLLNNLRLGEAIEVLNAVSDYVGDRLGQPLDFRALIADPLASGAAQIAPGFQSFARVAAIALRRFGGQYADLAHRLESTVTGRPVQIVEPVAGVKVDRKPKHAEAVKSTVTVRALLVGANKHSSREIHPLQGPVNDVQLTQSWLQGRCGVSPSNIVLLVDSRATKRGIIDAWRQMAAQLQVGDQLFFHFSGNDQQIASTDPNEADGLEESLVVYDSIPGERATLLTVGELADLAAEVEQRGGQVILVLDSCRMASGLLSRRGLRDTVVFAGAAEAEMAYETQFAGNYYGSVSYFLAEAMQAYKPGMTWVDAHDYVLANIRQKGFRQTPQLIGPGERTVFGSEQKSVPPHLLVIKADEREAQIYAPAALGLRAGENGARLAIYPPGSAMDGPPIGLVRVKGIMENAVTAAWESPVKVPVASRVKVLDTGHPEAVIRAALTDDLLERMGTSSLVAFLPQDATDLDFTVSVVNGIHVIKDRQGRVIWREPLASDTSLEAHAGRIRTVLEQIVAYRRTLAIRNQDVRSELTGKVDLEVIVPARSGVVTLHENEPLTLRLRNRAADNLYVSVWMFDQNLGLRRIFPAATGCVVLGEGREIHLAVQVMPNGSNHPAPISFKVFASVEPADLSILSLQPLDQPVDLRALDAREQPSSAAEPTIAAAKKAIKAVVAEQPALQAWIPGGPVALTSKLWNTGGTLRIKFLKGDPVVQKKVRKVAVEWIKYANLKFEFVSQGDAELRVDFEPGASWSYIGTDSLTVPKDECTINLGPLKQNTPDEELRFVVIHEFGHALGLAASQQSPISEIPWNKKATYAYYAKMGWDRKAVEANIFGKYKADATRYGPPDPDSIMYHHIPPELTDGKIEIIQRSELSEGDKRLVAELYPYSTLR